MFNHTMCFKDELQFYLHSNSTIMNNDGDIH